MITRTILMCAFTLAAVHSAAAADGKVLSVADLNTAQIIGELGVPLHTVYRVECRVVDMTFTNAKADDGRLALQILSVDGKVREGKHYIDLPESPGARKPQAGQTWHFWAYETVTAAGYPAEAFDKIGEQPKATTGLHFRSRLVVLKRLVAEPPKQQTGGTPAGE